MKVRSKSFINTIYAFGIKKPNGVALIASCACGVVLATTSTNVDFISAVTLLKNWTQGTLGTVIELSGMIIGIAIGISEQSVMTAAKMIGGVAVIHFIPSVVDTVFGALI